MLKGTPLKYNMFNIPMMLRCLFRACAYKGVVSFVVVPGRLDLEKEHKILKFHFVVIRCLHNSSFFVRLSPI